MFTYATRQACRLAIFNFFAAPISSSFRHINSENVDQGHVPAKAFTSINRKHPHQLSPRMHGTVTAFKHRRGYGFILAEGYLESKVDESKLCSKECEKLSEMETKLSDNSAKHVNVPENSLPSPGEVYFFIRKSLNGGFYLTEGERVSFNVIDVRPEIEKCPSNEDFDKLSPTEMQRNDKECNRTTESSEVDKRSFNTSESTTSFSNNTNMSKTENNTSYRELESYTIDNSVMIDNDDEEENFAEDFGVTRDGYKSHLYRSKQSAKDSQKNINSNSDNKSLEMSKRAIYIRHYDPKTGKESVIRPVLLNGKVVEWDAIEGIGMISELDINNEFHDDAPLFTFTLENLCLPDTVQISTGRFVSFCTAERNEVKSDTEELVVESNGNKKNTAEKNKNKLTENCQVAKDDINELTSKNLSEQHTFHPQTSLPVADKIILNIRMERAERRKMERCKTDNVKDNIEQRGGESQRQKHIGVIREISQSGRYGFIIDDASGSSIFFHLSNALTPVHAGDRVEYEVREIKLGKHAGKATCERIRQLTETYSSSILQSNKFGNVDGTGNDSTLQNNKQKQNNIYRKGIVDTNNFQNLTNFTSNNLEDIDDFDLLDETIEARGVNKYYKTINKS